MHTSTTTQPSYTISHITTGSTATQPSHTISHITNGSTATQPSHTNSKSHISITMIAIAIPSVTVGVVTICLLILIPIIVLLKLKRTSKKSSGSSLFFLLAYNYSLLDTGNIELSSKDILETNHDSIEVGDNMAYMHHDYSASGSNDMIYNYADTPMRCGQKMSEDPSEYDYLGIAHKMITDTPENIYD